MKNLLLAMTMLLTLTLVSCAGNSLNSKSDSSQKLVIDSTLPQEAIGDAPPIPAGLTPQEAHYPLRRSRKDPTKVVPTFQYRECVKRFIWCTKWEPKRLELDGYMEWFLANKFKLVREDGL